MKFSFVVILLSCLLTACAQEQSAEVRLREQTDREYERLSKAAGVYQGYLINADSRKVPVTVTVLVTKNPTASGEKPVLSLGMRVGLFGGVTIASSSTTFDWGKSEMTASFKRPGASAAAKTDGNDSNPSSGDGASGLELRGTIVDGKLTNGTLIGPHLKSQLSLVVEKNGADLFDPAIEWRYNVAWDDGKAETDLRAILELNNRSLTQTAPPTTDLPYLSGLSASLKFQSFASVPQTAEQVLYDPLAGTFDIQFTPSAWIRTTGVFLVEDTKRADVAPKPVTIRGTLTRGGAFLKNVQLDPLVKPFPLGGLPAASFIGTQGGSMSRHYKIAAYLTFQLGTGLNDASKYPFIVFPQMELKLAECLGDDAFETPTYKLISIDYLDRKALFAQSANGSSWAISFERDWSRVTGVFSDSTVTGDVQRLMMEPNVDVATKGCAVPLPTGFERSTVTMP